ncbi:MAG: type II toxin-antitoxin system RelE/ParE family toxin [Oscillospiraceae bacterium]|nr:type II toxin-antitoxin system RelE/ParE family toxin [Oscillospiraceae bacterium]
MEADYTVTINKEAKKDLRKIDRYISHNLANPIAARNFNANFRRIILLTRSNPLMWSKVQNENAPDKTIRKIPLKNYLIFYRPVEETREIQVLRVIPGMMDYEDIL